ncbi:MAG: Methylenetetrahydrofolate reductase, partial [Candidatus Hydrogenedentes bacterium]|nr:Methylenetetrahydrofolate reductase [Candidatus Hydrogenedentota bacterium]
YLERFVTRSEHFGKGMLFDCRTCGQCVLTHTRLVCPMTCPKQLRNGPCGGSLNEHCEVYPDRLCVWVRIHNRVDKGGTSCPILLDSPDPKLFHTSSYINLFTGKDKRARTPIPYLELPPNRKTAPVQTESGLERKLKAGKFVFTSEIRSPRGANPGMVEKQALILKDDFDAVNATAYLNGHASMPSSVASAIMVKLGVEPICQAACRDHTKTSFVSELIMNKMNGVHNVLCLTGDYYQGEPVPKQVFDLDSALMIFEARHFRETGAIHYSGDTLKEPPKPFLGGAINPFTTPQNVPIRRIKQKCAAGADFIQTQVILDMDVFKRFMKMFCDEGLDKELFLIAGLPVIISKKAFEMLPGVPGVVCPDAITKRMNGAEDIVTEGIQLAREMIQEVRQIQGVNGVHLMLFGMDHTVLPRVVEGLKDETKEGE